MTPHQRAVVRASRTGEVAPVNVGFPRRVTGHISGYRVDRDGGLCSVERDVLDCGHEVSAPQDAERVSRICWECER